MNTCKNCRGTGKRMARMFSDCFGGEELPPSPPYEIMCFRCKGTGRVLTEDEHFAWESEHYPPAILQPRWPSRFPEAVNAGATNSVDLEKLEQQYRNGRMGLSTKFEWWF